MIVLDLQIAFAIGDRHIAVVEFKIGRHFAGQIDLEVGLLRRTGPEADLHFRTLLAAASAQRDHVAFGRERGLIALKYLFGRGFVFSADDFANVDLYFVLVPGSDNDVAVIGNGFKVRTGRKGLFQIVLEGVTGATHIETNVRGVHPRGDAGDTAKDHQKDEEHHASSSDAGTVVALLLSAIVFEDFYQPPQNDQDRPEVGEAVEQDVNVHHPKVSQQEQESDEDENNGAGHRAA